MAGRRRYSDEERAARRKESWTRQNRKAAAKRGPRARGDACNCVEVDYTDEERAFLVAVDRYKSEAGVRFPTLTQLLAVLKSLGYRRVVD